MPSCYRCQAPVQSTDVSCRRCGAELKAFGHAGIPVHRSVDGQSLCLSCVYHVDDSCDYPKRPNALDCTLYRSVDYQAEPVKRPGARSPQSMPVTLWVIVGGVLLLALWLFFR
jgi:hypothetical protein